MDKLKHLTKCWLAAISSKKPECVLNEDVLRNDAIKSILQIEKKDVKSFIQTNFTECSIDVVNSPVLTSCLFLLYTAYSQKPELALIKNAMCQMDNATQLNLASFLEYFRNLDLREITKNDIITAAEQMQMTPRSGKYNTTPVGLNQSFHSVGSNQESPLMQFFQTPKRNMSSSRRCRLCNNGKTIEFLRNQLEDDEMDKNATIQNLNKVSMALQEVEQKLIREATRADNLQAQVVALDAELTINARNYDELAEKLKLTLEEDVILKNETKFLNEKLIKANDLTVQLKESNKLLQIQVRKAEENSTSSSSLKDAQQQIGQLQLLLSSKCSEFEELNECYNALKQSTRIHDLTEESFEQPETAAGVVDILLAETKTENAELREKLRVLQEEKNGILSELQRLRMLSQEEHEKYEETTQLLNHLKAENEALLTDFNQKCEIITDLKSEKGLLKSTTDARINQLENELSKLQSLLSEAKDHRLQLEKLEAERSLKFGERELEYKREKDGIQASLVSSQQELEKVVETNGDLNEILNHIKNEGEREIYRLESELKNLQTQFDAEKDRASKMDSELQITLEKMEETKRDFHDAINQAKTESESLMNDLNHKCKTITDLENENGVLKSNSEREIHGLTSELKNLQSQFDAEQDRALKLDSELQISLGKIEEAKQDLNDAINQAKAESESLMNDLNQKCKTITDLEDTNNVLKSNSEREIHRLESELKNIQSQFDAEQDRALKLDSELQITVEKMEETKQDFHDVINQAKTTSESLLNDLNQKCKTITDLEDTNNVLKSNSEREIHRLESELKNLQSQFDAEQDRALKLDSELQITVEKMEETKQDFHDVINQAKTKSESLMNDLNQKSKTITDLEETNNVLKSNSEREIHRLKSELENLQSQFDAERDRALKLDSELQITLEKMEETKREFHDVINQAKTESEYLMNDLNQKSKTITDLEDNMTLMKINNDDQINQLESENNVLQSLLSAADDRATTLEAELQLTLVSNQEALVKFEEKTKNINQALNQSKTEKESLLKDLNHKCEVIKELEDKKAVLECNTELEISQLKRALEDSKSLLLIADERATSIDEKLQCLLVSNQISEESNKDLVATLSQTKAETETLLTNLNQKCDIIRELEDERSLLMSSTDSKINQLQKELDVSKILLKEAEELNAKLNTELQIALESNQKFKETDCDLNKALNQAQTEAEALLMNLNQKCQMISDLENEKTVLKSNLECEIHRLENELKNSESQFSASENCASKLKAELQLALASNQKALQQFEETTRDLNEAINLAKIDSESILNNLNDKCKIITDLELLKANSEREVHRLQSELKNLQSQFDAEQERGSKLDSELQISLGKIEETKRDLNDAINQAKAESESLLKDLNQKCKIITDLENENDVLKTNSEREIHGLVGELNNLQSQFVAEQECASKLDSELQISLGKIEETKRNLNDVMNQAKAESESLSEDLKQKCRIITDLENENDVLKSNSEREIHGLASELKNLQSQFDAEQDRASKLDSELQITLEKMKETKRDLNDAINQAKAESESLLKDLNQKCKIITDLENGNELLKANSEREIHQLASELKNLQSLFDAEQDRALKLDSELQISLGKIEETKRDLNDAINQAKAESESLLNNLNDKCKIITDLELLKANSECEIHRLQSEHKNLQSQFDAEQERASKLDSELQISLGTIEETKRDLNDAINLAKAENESLLKDLNQKCKTITDLEDTHNVLKSNSEREIHRLDSELKNLQFQFDAEKERVSKLDSELQISLGKIEETKQDFNDTINQTKCEIESLLKDLNEKSEIIIHLEEEKTLTKLNSDGEINKLESELKDLHLQLTLEKDRVSKLEDELHLSVVSGEKAFKKLEQTNRDLNQVKNDLESLLNDKTRIIFDMEDELNLLKSTSDGEIKTLDSLKILAEDRVSKLEGELQLALASNQKALEQLEETTRDLNQAKSEMESLLKNLNEKSKTISSTEDEKNALKSLLHTSEAKNLEMESSLKCLKEELSKAENNYLHFEQRALSLAEINSRLSTELLKLKNVSSNELKVQELSEARSTIVDLSGQIEKLKSALAKKVSDSEQAEAVANSSLASLEDALKNLKTFCILKTEEDLLIEQILKLNETVIKKLTVDPKDSAEYQPLNEKRKTAYSDLEQIISSSAILTEKVQLSDNFSNEIFDELHRRKNSLTTILTSMQSVEDALKENEAREELSDSLEIIPISAQDATFEIVNLYDETFSVSIHGNKTMDKVESDTRSWIVSPPKNKGPARPIVKKERVTNGESWIVPLGPAPAKPVRKTDAGRARSSSVSSTKSLPCADKASGRQRQQDQLTEKVSSLEVELGRTNREKETISRECQIKSRKLNDLEQKIKIEREQATATRQKYEKQLEHLKGEMRQLYNQEVGKYKREFARKSEEMKCQVRSLSEQNEKYKKEIDELRELNRRSKEQIDELGNQMWNLGDKVLQVNAPMQSMTLPPMVDSKISSEMSSTSSRPHQSSLFPPLLLEDEDEIFDNQCLEELKNGPSHVENRSRRLAELQMRNSLCLPHLKSSYPAETQFHSPKMFSENALRSSSLNFNHFESQSLTDSSDPSMTRSLLPNDKGKKKEQTSYKRPGPPTPSKNGRPSLKGNEQLLRLTPKKALKEQNSQEKGRGTPNRLKALFTSRGSKRDSLAGQNASDENVAPTTPRGKGLRIFQRKPFGGRDF